MTFNFSGVCHIFLIKTTVAVKKVSTAERTFDAKWRVACEGYTFARHLSGTWRMRAIRTHAT